MQVSVTRYADVLVIAAGGRIDYLNADEFKTALLPHIENSVEDDRILLDLSKLEYISSAGLRVLVIAAKEARARRGRMLAVALQPAVREIFEISRFTLVFEIFDSVQDALRKISTVALAAFQSK